MKDLLQILLCIIAYSGLAGCSDESALKPAAFGSAHPIGNDCPDVLPNVGGDLCGLYQVPLDWTSTEAQTIDVFLRSFPRNTASRGQLWVIDGGPGASGATFSDPGFVALIHQMGWDLYLPMHRGIGFSSYLDCGINQWPLDEDYVSICSDVLRKKYADKINWFSAVGAAHDLNYLIQHNNPGNLPVVMMGTSYGTYLTQRFLQLFDSNIDAAILLSGTNLAPRFEFVSHQEEQTFRRLLTLCSDQSDCAAMFEYTAYEAAQALILDDGWQSCSQIVSNQQEVSIWFRNLAASQLREKLPLTIKKLTRCNRQDAEWLAAQLLELNELESRKRQQLFQFNPLMNHHQIFTELLSPEQEIPTPFDFPENALLGKPASTYVSLRKDWLSRTPPLELPNQLSTEIPILALHGGLDIQASVEWFDDLTSQLTSSTQHAILFPTAGHGTPSYTALNRGENCSWLLVEEFLNGSKHQLNTQCVKEVKPLRFVTE